MNKKILLICTLSFLAILLIVGSVSAKATVYKDEYSYWVDTIIDNMCPGIGDGEDVHLTGTIHSKYMTVLDGNGGFHDKLHEHSNDFRGTGLTSGDTYVGTYANSSTWNGSVGETMTVTIYLNLISKGSRDNIQIRERAHYTINANGELTVDNYKFEVVCK